MFRNVSQRPHPYRESNNDFSHEGFQPQQGSQAYVPRVPGFLSGPQSPVYMDRDYSPAYSAQALNYNEQRPAKRNKDSKYALPNFPEFGNATDPARAPPSMSAYRRFVLIIYAPFTLAARPHAPTPSLDAPAGS